MRRPPRPSERGNLRQSRSVAQYGQHRPDRARQKLEPPPRFGRELLAIDPERTYCDALRAGWRRFDTKPAIPNQGSTGRESDRCLDRRRLAANQHAASCWGDAAAAEGATSTEAIADQRLVEPLEPLQARRIVRAADGREHARECA